MYYTLTVKGTPQEADQEITQFTEKINKKYKYKTLNQEYKTRMEYDLKEFEQYLKEKYGDEPYYDKKNNIVTTAREKIICTLQIRQNNMKIHHRGGT